MVVQGFKKIYKYIKAACVALCALSLLYIVANTEEASVSFSSDGYAGEEGDEIPVNVKISSDVPMGEYYVEIHFDPTTMSYISGADKVDLANGVLILQAPGNSDSVSRRLVFKSDSIGESALYATNSIVLAPGTADQMYNISNEGRAILSVNRKPDATPTPTETPTATPTETPTATPTETPTATPKEDLLEDSEPIETHSYDLENVAPTEIPVEKAPESLLEAVRNEAQAGSVDNIEEYHIGEEKKDFFDKLTETFPALKGKTLYLVTGLIVLLSLLIVVLVILVIKNLIQEIHNDYEYEDENENDTDTGNQLCVNSGEEDIIWIDMPGEGDWNDDILHIPEEKPVISVRNVTMKYRISTSNVSGIKEFLIQKLKKQVNYRELLALDNVSFDVYKGEVIGIIGTNGSGKSTILKIIAGALRPTSGNVIVDHKKIQILTLGTGFDMELTARENVYLNGSIIGYSKQFLDEHYEKIVEFAELEGFMEEKVKNFSSGMVSRLGFAIATAGDAAEILILDEVLSVGDEFFRKKSLARVQEMIHGGSTVLMVSHSMDTIRKNCSKVVWIEKGELKMIGEPEIACSEYQCQRMENNI